jgi:hypothetical protein
MRGNFPRHDLHGDMAVRLPDGARGVPLEHAPVSHIGDRAKAPSPASSRAPLRFIRMRDACNGASLLGSANTSEGSPMVRRSSAARSALP